MKPPEIIEIDVVYTWVKKKRKIKIKKCLKRSMEVILNI